MSTYLVEGYLPPIGYPSYRLAIGLYLGIELNRRNNLYTATTPYIKLFPFL